MASAWHFTRQRVSLGLVNLSLLGGLMGSCDQLPKPPPAAEVVPAESAPEAEAPSTDTLRLLYGRLPTTLNPHLANGFQDFEAARIVYEPLASYDAAGNLMPILAATAPTPDNGGVAADGRSVTWQLRQGVVWSDGTPFTAADVVFTFEFASNPVVAAATADYYEAIETVEALDDHTVKVTFNQPTPAWDLPFVGQNGLILPAHLFAEVNNEQARAATANLRPVGTGPYRFVAADKGRWLFVPNDRYRDAAPDFERLELQGGVVPYGAALQVLQSGTADFAHNLQLAADQLATLTDTDTGRLVTRFGPQVERIMFNFADPDTETETGERASPEIPHPFLSDRTVRRAIDLAIDRAAIAAQYGNFGRPTRQLLVAPSQYVSEQITYTYDPAQAQALLAEAGWQDTNGNGIRDQNGVEMQLRFRTSVNPVRQETQALVKQFLAEVGIEVINERIRIDDFFSPDPAQSDSLNHFYADLQEYATGNATPDPTVYLSWWTCGEIAQQANQWQKPNNARYCNPTYDSLWQAANNELDPAQRAVLFRRMDELLAEDVALMPLVHRATTHGISQRLTGYELTPWDASTWDIANWRRRD
ncbi:MAG: peptide ABC transporter substrate-binding protein [Cyanobacteria bacterium P01_A01_bin.105]